MVIESTNEVGVYPHLYADLAYIAAAAIIMIGAYMYDYGPAMFKRTQNPKKTDDPSWYALLKRSNCMLIEFTKYLALLALGGWLVEMFVELFAWWDYGNYSVALIAPDCAGQLPYTCWVAPSGTPYVYISTSSMNLFATIAAYVLVSIAPLVALIGAYWISRGPVDREEVPAISEEDIRSGKEKRTFVLPARRILFFLALAVYAGLTALWFTLGAIHWSYSGIDSHGFILWGSARVDFLIAIVWTLQMALPALFFGLAGPMLPMMLMYQYMMYNSMISAAGATTAFFSAFYLNYIFVGFLGVLGFLAYMSIDVTTNPDMKEVTYKKNKTGTSDLYDFLRV